MEIIHERELVEARQPLVAASFTAWQIGLILDNMFSGKKSKWKPFGEWLSAMGLSDAIQSRKRHLSPQEAIMESQRIRTKFDSISQKILEQRAKQT